MKKYTLKMNDSGYNTHILLFLKWPMHFQNQKLIRKFFSKLNFLDNVFRKKPIRLRFESVHLTHTQSNQKVTAPVFHYKNRNISHTHSKQKVTAPLFHYKNRNISHTQVTKKELRQCFITKTGPSHTLKVTKK